METHNPIFQGYEINTSAKYGIYTDILDSAIKQIDAMQSFHNKVYLLRFDLHLPNTDTPISDAKGKALISAFFKSIKEKLSSKKEDSLTRVAYQWAFEVEKSKKGHYHCWIAVDGNKKQKPGSIKEKTGLIGLVTREWEKVSSGTVRLAGAHQEDQGHQLRRGDKKAKDDCIHHISYLAKVRSKGYGGKRKGSSNYGTSKLKAKVIH
jgi:hypothetical protein